MVRDTDLLGTNCDENPSKLKKADIVGKDAHEFDLILMECSGSPSSVTKGHTSNDWIKLIQATWQLINFASQFKDASWFSMQQKNSSGSR